MFAPTPAFNLGLFFKVWARLIVPNEGSLNANGLCIQNYSIYSLCVPICNKKKSLELFEWSAVLIQAKKQQQQKTGHQLISIS